ncbi:YdcF family protein [Hazenella sp. IB182357]|uniref:YdcF family protein n=1 Tax=Polycladospora coralii TaxID=2771432 RepID=A0A926RTA3_9BACL|nr:YdcF family protein [Polycladospora coralii]MBD1372570.1 YdcF family protein [Polycladospora coralii]MBS7531307.1 YdcF family protein [Polycladospora coralii]
MSDHYAPYFLSEVQIQKITEVVFSNPSSFPQLDTYDLMLIFGGSHPAIWRTATSAFWGNKTNKILITGGYKKQPNLRHNTWIYGETPEAIVIREKLLQSGIPRSAVHIETRSTNSLQNVLYARATFPFHSTRTVLFVSKAYAVGRQYRTLKQHMPPHIQFTPLPVSVEISGKPLTPQNWLYHPVHRRFVLDEFRRIIHYGRLGHLQRILPSMNPFIKHPSLPLLQSAEMEK